MPEDARLDMEDDEYESSQDSDFAPEDAPDAAADESDSDADEPAAADADQTKRKRDAAGEAEEAGFENSGDEAIITKGQKKRRKRRKGDDGASDDEAGGGGGDGGGGVVKTRSMRAQEKAEKKVAAVQGPVTIDVDAVWAQMMAGTPTPAAAERQGDAMDVDGSVAPEAAATAAAREAPEMIRIKRTYNFAGKVHTEEKMVARDSAEARLYLASRDKAGDEGEADGKEDDETGKPRRVLRRAFRSAFEPVMEGAGGRADLDLGVEGAIRAREGRAEAAKKLNTVEKSRMDWAGFVDKEGLKDELEMAGRSKGAYAEREGFLARSEAKREEDAWRARQAARA